MTNHTQATLGRALGLDQRSMSRLETTREPLFIRVDVANGLVRELPLTMAELLHAAGFNVANMEGWIPGELRSVLECPTEEEKGVILTTLRGLLAARVGQELPGPRRGRQRRQAHPSNGPDQRS